MDSIGSVNLLGPIIAAAERNIPPVDGDYLDDEGFLMCGKCHTRKQCEITMPAVPFGEGGQMMKVPVMCDCMKAGVEREEEEDRKRQDMYAIQRLRRASLIDTALHDATFDNCRVDKDNAKNLKMCRRYAERFDEMLEQNMGLLFYGDVGTGKSYSAACIANYLLARRVPVVMTSFIKLLSSMQNISIDNEDLIRRLNRAKLLIIDDLGAERGTEYAIENVYNVIDSRYRSRLPLIITTNLSLKEVRNPVDDRYSRIYDRLSGLFPMEFTGISYRKADAATQLNKMKQILEGDD